MAVETTAYSLGAPSLLQLVRSAADWYREKQSTRQYTGRLLDVYDLAAEFLAQRRQFAARVAEIVGDEPGQTVVELAAGTGLVSSVLKKELRHSKLAFFDLSFSALQKLRERLGSDSNAATADFFRLPIAAASVDKVVIVGGYRYVGEREEDFWREVSRVVKDQSSVYIAQFKPRISAMRGNDSLSVVDDERKAEISRRFGFRLVDLTDCDPGGATKVEDIAAIDNSFEPSVRVFGRTVVTGKYELVRFQK